MTRISLLYLLFLGAAIVKAESLIVHGVANPTIVEKQLRGIANNRSLPPILEFTNASSIRIDNSAIHYFSGKLFEKPAKAMWFYKNDAKASLLVKQYLGKSALLMNNSKGITFALHIDSKESFPVGDIDLIYNHTIVVSKEIYQTLRYQLARQKDLRVKLPPEIAHITSVLNVGANPSIAKINSYSRTVEGEGAHRRVSTRMKIATHLSECRVRTVEPVLEEHFIETDFLKDLPGCVYWINEDCNIELPSTHVPQYLLSFEFSLSSEASLFYTLTQSNDGYELAYKYPYHFRYQLAGAKAYEPVEILNPLVYLMCDDDNLEASYVEAKSIEEIVLEQVLEKSGGVSVEYEKAQQVWRGKVPVGQLKDKPIVAIGTVAITLVSALAIVCIAMRKSVPID